MFLVLLLFEIFRLAMRAPIVPLRYFALYAALAIFLSGWGQVRKYSTQGFDDRRPAPKDSSSSIAPHSIWRHCTRRAGCSLREVCASGSIRGLKSRRWAAALNPGLTTRMPLNLELSDPDGREQHAAERRRRRGGKLKTLGAEYVVVHGPKSREHYRDFKNPRKFDGLLEAVWHEEDDTIYRVPFSSLAHVVRHGPHLALVCPGAGRAT